MFAVFSLGAIEVLILLVLIVGISFLILKPRLRHKVLLVLILVGLGLAFGLLFRGLIDEHAPPVARVLCFLGLLLVTVLFLAVMLRLFAPMISEARPAPPRPGAWKDAPDASLVARIGRLPIRAVLLASTPLALLAFLIVIAVWPPRQPGDMFAAMFVIFFFWALFAVPFALTVWLCRMSSQGSRQAVRSSIDRMAERLPPLPAPLRINGWPLVIAAFVFGVLALMFLVAASGPGDSTPSAMMVVLCLSAAIFFGTWAALRFWGVLGAGAPLSSCPPIGQLKALLADRLPSGEQARLTLHLEGCAACQHRLEGLTAGQKSWAGLAGKLSERPPSPEPALRQVMDRLKEDNEETGGEEPILCGDLPLGFLNPSDKPGQLGRLERYEVLEEIGRGGMGVVFKAFDPTLHRVVAIKVLAPQLATSGVARKRFLREAKAAAAVTHDHIVTIHAVEEANGLPYLVMQYVAGQSLQDRIDRDGPLELADVVRIGMQTASGLAAAHAHGIVHRDIKPANILLEEGVGRVKLTDFGLARAMDDASLTQSGFVAGSPLYMAPEQARGEALDHRADLFSLGSVLYTMCTGRPPFRAANTLAVLRRVSEDAPRPIRETNPEIPEWLAAVVDRLLAKHPEDRYPSANEVVEVLGRHLAQLQGASWAPPPAAAGPEPGLPTSLTICPSCGANLHVPEHMVGTLVHCAECGKPFQVEETAEVIQVARPMKPPLGPAFRRRRRRVPGCVLIAACFVVLVLLFVFGYFMSRQSAASRSAQVALAEQRRKAATTTAPARATTALPVPPGDPFWKNSLGWLPPEATYFGAIDLKPFGSASLDDARTQALLRLVASEKTANKLTPENLGRIRLDGLALAYYDDPKLKDERLIVYLTGLALDGRKRILDFLNRETTEKLRIEENNGSGTNRAIRVSSAALPFALGIYDDNHAFLAASGAKDAGTDQHRKALMQVSGLNFNEFPVPGTNLLTGYNPPWLRNALNEVPPDACGLFIGEIPAEMRKLLTDALKLRACPRSFVCFLTKRGSGVGVSLTLNVDKAGGELLLLQDLEKWRREGLNVWQARCPALRKEPEALALVGRELQGMRWGANPASRSVRTTVDVSGPTWDALLKLLKRASQ